MFEKYFTPTKPNKAVKVTFTSVPCGQDTASTSGQQTHQNVTCVYYNMFKLLETHGGCVDTVGACFAPMLPCYQFTANLSHHLCVVWGLGSIGDVKTWHLKTLQEYVNGVGNDTPQAWLDLITIYCVAKKFSNKFSKDETRKQGLSLVRVCQNKCKSLGQGFQAYLLEIMVTMTKSCMYTASLSELYKENSNLLLVFQHEHDQGVPYTLPVQFGNNEPGYDLPINVCELRNLINYGYLLELGLKFCNPKDTILKKAKSLITSRSEYNSVYNEHMKHTVTNELGLMFSYRHWDNTTLRSYTQHYIDNIMCLSQTEYKGLVPMYTNFTLTWLAKQFGVLPPDRFKTIHSLIQKESDGFFTEKEFLVLLSYYNTESKETFANVVYQLMDCLSRFVKVKTYMYINLPYTPPSFQYLSRYLITVKHLLENSVFELKEHSVQAPIGELNDLLLEMSYTCVDLSQPNDPTTPHYLATSVINIHKHITYEPKKISPDVIAMISRGENEAYNSVWQVEQEAFSRFCNTIAWKRLKKDQEMVDQSMVWVAPALLFTESLYDYIADLDQTNDTPDEVKQLFFIHKEPINWKEKVEKVLDYYDKNPINTTYRIELFVSTLVIVLGYYMVLVDNPQLTKRLLQTCRKLVEYLLEMCVRAYKDNKGTRSFRNMKTRFLSVPLHVLGAMRASEHVCYQGGKPC